MRAAAVFVCLFASCSHAPRPDLPTLETAKFLPAVRGEIQPAYEAARAHPDDAAAVGKLGMVLDAHEQYDSAAACYLRAQRIDSKAFDWPYHLGCVRSAQGRNEEAIAALESALRIRDYAPAHVKLADAMFGAGKLDESARLYETVIGADSGNAAAWYGRGRISDMRGDASKAVEFYKKACHLFPAYGAAHYALALLYRKQGRSGEAAAEFRAWEQNKTAVPPVDDPVRAAVTGLRAGTDVHIRRAAALEQQGRFQEAVDEHLSALQLDPKLAQAHINLISLYGRLGNRDEAEKHYRAAMALNPSAADAEYNYGVLLFNRGEQEEAERAFRRALADNPQHSRAHNNLGYLFEQQGKAAAALSEYEKALQTQPDYRLAHFHAGRILANERQYARAISHLQKTIEPDDESTPGYLYALAATYARAGQTQNAIVYAKRARDDAAQRGQTDLLASIEKDLRRMQAHEGRP